MSKQYGFQQQLSKGLQAQKEFADFYEIELLDGTGADMKLANGALVELKTDFRNSKRTGNLFIERYSSSLKKSDGGPWKAKTDGCMYFVYKFDDIVLCYLVDELLEFLNKNIQNYTSKRINNGSYDTLGYLVPIHHVSHIALDFRQIVLDAENEVNT